LGLFVVFEGIEGSGKTTQAKALHRRLARLGHPSILVQEPGGTPTGERVRRWLKAGMDITPLAEVFLLSAARAALVENKIGPALERGQTVVCDRYFYSTLAYQGYGRGIDMDILHQVNRIATRGLLPNLVVLLDMPPEEGLARKGQPRDRFEREGIQFHQRVRQGYLALAQQEPERWLLLDGLSLPQALSHAIEKRVLALLRESEGTT